MAWALAGCASDHAVIASTATTIGVEVSSNPTTGVPTGVLGYRRAEFAFVPTNRAKAGEAVDTKNPNHAAVLGRWGRALSLLCFLASHERQSEHTWRPRLRHHPGGAPSCEGTGS